MDITNAANWHLALNHMPVVGSLMGFLLLLWATLRKSRELTTTALGVLVAVAVISVPAYLTGEPAEEVVENLPGVTESLIHGHEEAAELAFIAMLALGAVSLGGLILQSRAPKLFSLSVKIALAGAAVVTGLMLRTAHLGGYIRHPEIRPAGMATEVSDED